MEQEIAVLFGLSLSGNDDGYASLKELEREKKRLENLETKKIESKVGGRNEY